MCVCPGNSKLSVMSQRSNILLPLMVEIKTPAFVAADCKQRAKQRACFCVTAVQDEKKKNNKDLKTEVELKTLHDATNLRNCRNLYQGVPILIPVSDIGTDTGG